MVGGSKAHRWQLSKLNCRCRCNPKTGCVWLHLSLAKKPPQEIEYVALHEACMKAQSQKPTQLRFASCVLALRKWAKIQEMRQKRICRTLEIRDLIADTAASVENSHKKGQTRFNAKSLEEYSLHEPPGRDLTRWALPQQLRLCWHFPHG
ncbi:MAG: M48 family metallopeptidase [Rhodobacteraceae bacterium]|nr:M48 family metallopeptidase [Paracoccaceae bacterium]